MLKEGDVLICPNCGAPLPESRGEETACPYCGVEVAPGAAPAKAPARDAVDLRALYEQRAAEKAEEARHEAQAAARAAAIAGEPIVGSKSHRRGIAVAVIAGAAVIAGVAGLIWWLGFSGLHGIEYWDDQAGLPIVTTIGGHEAFLGVGRGRAKDVLYVVAVDARDVSPIWKAGSFGSFSAGSRYTHVAVAGKRAAVTDYRGRLHILALATGKTLRTLWLSDRSDKMCPVGDGHSVWVHVIDKRSVKVDLAKGTKTAETEPPPGCAAGKLSHRSMEEAAAAAALRRDRAAERAAKHGPGKSAHKPAGAAEVAATHQSYHFDGFESEHAWRDGDIAVAAGVKTPGTPVPEAVEFDPSTHHINWQVTIPTVDIDKVHSFHDWKGTHDALGNGRFLATYLVGHHGIRLTAFDAHTGKRLWDVAMPSGFMPEVDGLVVTKDRILVEREEALDVFDASNGHHLRRIGRSDSD